MVASRKGKPPAPPFVCFPKNRNPLVRRLTRREADFTRTLIWIESGGPTSIPTPIPPVSTVTLSVPSSDVYAADLFNARRGLVGGTLARQWFSWTSSGGTRVVDFAHNGSSADPLVFVPALAGATRTNVDLGGVARTAEEVAQAVVDALVLDGVTASRMGTNITIEDASALVIPAAVDMTDTSLRGMWGLQRDNWGTGTEGQTLNINGGTNGTGSVHVGPLGNAGRVIGVYLWTNTGAGMDVRLAASIGPAYSVAPGVMTILGQGELSAQEGFGLVSFEAQAVGAVDELWVQYRGDNGGGTRLRLHTSTPEGNGQQGVGQALVFDTTAPQSAGAAFGATYTPTADTTFNIYISMGLIFEIPDGSGNYPANGALTLRVGDQNDDPDHGTQFDANAAQLTGENTHQRLQWINMTEISLISVTRTIVNVAADEDGRVSLYQWDDTDFPSTTPAGLIADLGLVGFNPTGGGNTAYTLTLGVPVAMGTEVLGPNAIISSGFNYVTTTGDPIATWTLPVFLTTAGDSYWASAWVDDRETWHDNIDGASDRGYLAGVQEYRQVGVVGSPFTSTAQTWPDPMITDAGDDSPPAIAMDWMVLTRLGFVEL
jgi:hypothetical protein